MHLCIVGAEPFVLTYGVGPVMTLGKARRAEMDLTALYLRLFVCRSSVRSSVRSTCAAAAS